MSHDDDPVSLPMSIPGTEGSMPVVVGIVAGLLPFVLSSTHVETVNGEVVSYVDYVAIGGGGLALLLGALGAIGGLRMAEGRGKKLALSAVALLLGGFQLARGFGLFA